MAKITVKASEDFFDGANQIPRVKGSEFVLKSEYAKTLGKKVTAVEKKEAVKSAKAERIEKSQAKNRAAAESAKTTPRKGIEIVEKVKKK